MICAAIGLYPAFCLWTGYGVTYNHLSTLLLLQVYDHVAHRCLGHSVWVFQDLSKDGRHDGKLVLAMIAGAVVTKAV